MHWLVGSKSGRIFLDVWDVVTPGSIGEQVEMVDTVNRALRQRAAGSHISRVFDRRRVLLPVIHPQSEREALESVEVATDARCAGIWLINQGMAVDEVLRLVMTVRAKHPFLWVGVNILGLSPAAALEKALGACGGRIDGIWSDDADVDERSTEQPEAKAFVAARSKHDWQGSYFGGVAFKYQREVADGDLARAAAAAAPFLDVVCSSGPGTGKAADPQKLARLREGLGKDGSLAVASGITAENIDSFLPDVDAYLVGTGIERSFGVLDADKVTRVQQRIDAWLAANPQS